jgi:hypothetical protein
MRRHVMVPTSSTFSNPRGHAKCHIQRSERCNIDSKYCMGFTIIFSILIDAGADHY